SYRLVRLPYSNQIIKNPSLKWSGLLKSSQIRQNHFNSKTYQVFTRLRERFTHVSFARFVSFGLIGIAASVYLIQKYNDLQTLQSFVNAKFPPIRNDIFTEKEKKWN
ncbi:hypothetical protein C2G38_2150148, partial [Gigaspora rosea]